MIKLPKQIYEVIYDLLEEHVGADSWHKDDFVEYFVQGGIEYRFCGNLGMGGKFYNNNEMLYISCYPEDETDKIYCIIEKVNSILNNMLETYLTSFGKVL